MPSTTHLISSLTEVIKPTIYKSANRIQSQQKIGKGKRDFPCCALTLRSNLDIIQYSEDFEGRRKMLWPYEMLHRKKFELL